MPFGYNHDQILRSDRCKLYAGLLFRHRTETDVIFFIFQPLYHLGRIAHCKPEFHIQLLISMYEITHKLRDKLASQRIDIRKFNYAFRLAGK